MIPGALIEITGWISIDRTCYAIRPMNKRLMSLLGKHRDVPIRLHIGSQDVVDGLVGLASDNKDEDGVERPISDGDVLIVFSFVHLCRNHAPDHQEHKLAPQVVFVDPSAVRAFEPAHVSRQELAAMHRARRGEFDDPPPKGALSPEELRALGIEDQEAHP